MKTPSRPVLSLAMAFLLIDGDMTAQEEEDASQLLAAYNAAKQAADEAGGQHFAPNQATGKPNTLREGPSPAAWHSESSFEEAWLELDYPDPVKATQVLVHETYQPGCIRELVLKDSSNNVLATISVQRGQEKAPFIRPFAIPELKTLTKTVRLNLASGGGQIWTGIDAVELVGEDQRAWAQTGRASGYLGRRTQTDVLPDRQVTFRLWAPEAREVKVAVWQISAVFHPPPRLKRDVTGTWNVTLGPVEPGFYFYGFQADGLFLTDPMNPEIYPSGPCSILEIPNIAEPWLYAPEKTPHGAVHLHRYWSETLQQMREVHVYTPPGYELNSGGRYPVLYLLHGWRQPVESWVKYGRVHWITDHLIHAGACVPMVIAMPYNDNAHWTDQKRLGGRHGFEAELLDQVVPLVEKNYRVKADPLSRAVAGLSMGGGQSLWMGLRHLDRFAWVGGFSSAVTDHPFEKECQPALDALRDKPQSLQLLWLTCGDKESLLGANQRFVNWLEAHQVACAWTMSKGDHTWTVWRRNIGDFLPLLFKSQSQSQ